MNNSFKKFILPITMLSILVSAFIFYFSRTINSKPQSSIFFGTSTILGKRAEDRIVIDTNGTTYLFSLFDGYGGKTTINYLAQEFHHIITQQLPENPTRHEIETALPRACAQVEQELLLMAQTQNSRRFTTPGSTATTVLITPNSIIVMNIGDSQVLLKKHNGSLWLSQGHKPDDPDEKERIEKAGITVDYLDVPRVLWHSTARGIGDFHFNKDTGIWGKTPGIVAQPSITTFDRAEIAWILIGSDGLWDGLSFELAPEVHEGNKKTLAKTTISAIHVTQVAEQISLFLKGSKNLTHLATLLTQKASSGWESSRRSVDDISAIMVVV